MLFVAFIGVLHVYVANSFPNVLFSVNNVDETPSDMKIPTDYSDALDNSNWISEPLFPNTFDLDVDVNVGEGNTDLFWDGEQPLANAAVDNSCISEVDGLSLEARDDASCSWIKQAEPELSSGMLSLFEDSTGIFESITSSREYQGFEVGPPDGISNDLAVLPIDMKTGEPYQPKTPEWIGPPHGDDCPLLRIYGYDKDVCCDRPYEHENPQNPLFNTNALVGCVRSKFLLRYVSEITYLFLDNLTSFSEPFDFGCSKGYQACCRFLVRNRALATGRCGLMHD